ncbi:endonuclease 4-like [Silene latifolia]|uniref:endonuclease 4-like n=1 Tax=Silene latifolia TaxID=37657 RepID=UPI003D789A90
MALLNVYSISVALVFFQLIPAILSWGEAGHYATCKIAQDYLTEAAKDAMKELLPKSANGELADVCSWPDLPEIRKGYPWSGELHYANAPNFACSFDYCRDCHNAANVKNRCVVGAVYNYTRQLESVYHHYGAYSKYNLTEALMFLAHFMGDLHQPLHLGYSEDLGGNRIIISWYNKTTNLHRVWDDEIIDTALERYYGSNLTNLIEAIKSNITDDRLISEIKSSEACHHSVCPNQYAEESISLACKYAYKDATNGTQLNDDYFHSRLPIVEKRLAQGGVRLAALLEEIFGAKTRMQMQKQVISAIY